MADHPPLDAMSADADNRPDQMWWLGQKIGLVVKEEDRSKPRTAP
jgi:hypothetical protein